MRRSVAAVGLAGLVLTASLSSCAPEQGGGAGKAGGPVPPTVLTLVNHDSGSGTTTTPAAGRFVALVDELSHGQLRIEVDASTYRTDGREVADVAAGRAQLGWTGTRVFDQLGVPELQPLHAPFLIDSYELQAAVLRSDVPAAMQPALRRLGVEPLAILGDGLRHPATDGPPLLAPADWAGARIWLLDSRIQEQAVEALGARALHGGDIRQELQDDEAEALETMWLYYGVTADYLYAPVLADNVVLSPRTTALFANPDALARLTDEQRGWIRDAAAGAVTWSADHAGDQDATFRALSCRNGARIARATPAQLGALIDAVAPVYRRVRDDPATSATMRRIEQLKAELAPPAPPAVPDGCAYDPAAPAPPAPTPLRKPGDPGGFPVGSYRYELSEEEVEQAGDGDSILQQSRAGVFTWEMGQGVWTVTALPKAGDLDRLQCHGFYDVDGSLVTFSADPFAEERTKHCLPPVWTARWVAGEGSVQWGPPSVRVLRASFTRHPWQLVN